MADTLDTYIKSPSPPKDLDSQYVYNEQQFGSLEKALRKHHDKILEVNENATALYENEVIVRTTADSALVQTIETLDAKVDLNNTNTQATIQNIQTAFADSESATATKLSTLEAKVDSGDATNLALIRDEAKTRATKVDAIASKVSALEASVKVGQSESRALVKQETTARADAVSAEATKREALSAYVGYTDGQSYSKTLSAEITDEAAARVAADNTEATKRTNLSAYVGYIDGQSYTKTLAASLTDEQMARVAADTAVAQRVMSTSAGTSRVYSQTSAPSSSGRINGDIWIDTTVASGSTSPNLTPYVWYSGAWQDNSTGNYSQYAGNNATLTNISTVVYDPIAGSTYEWIVKGQLGTNSAGQSAIRLTGAQKPNGSGGYTTTSKFIIDSNTEINGNLIVTGSITGAQINTSGSGVNTDNLVDNSVSNSWYQAGTNGLTTKTIDVTAGRKYVIFAIYSGGQTSSSAGSANLDITYSYSSEQFIQSIPVVFSGTGLVLNVSFGYSSTTGSFVNGIGGTLNYTLPSATCVASWTAPTTGSVTIYGKIYIGGSGALSQPVNLYIVELKK